MKDHDYETVDTQKVKDINAHNYAKLMVLPHDDKETNNQQHVSSTDVRTNSSSSKELEIVHHDLNEEKKQDQNQVAVALEDSENLSADPMTKGRQIIDTRVPVPNIDRNIFIFLV